MISLKETNHVAAANFFFDNVHKECESRLEEKRKILSKYKTKSNKSLYTYLLENLKNLLIGELVTVSDEVIEELNDLFKEYYPTKSKETSELKSTIDYILFYEKYDTWRAYEVIKKLKIDCCPYCNRNYITTVGSDDKKFIRADYDHFLSKARYPYFRLSFYNLIPSCIFCNQKAKGRKDTNLKQFIYPYADSFGNDAKFSYQPSSYKQLMKGYGSKIFLQIGDPKSDKGKKIEKNKELFRIDEQYLIHHRELHAILDKKAKHPQGYIQALNSAFNGMFDSEAEIYEFIFGKSIDEEDFINQPLAKFTKDISELLGII